MADLSPSARAIYDAFNRIGLYNEPSFDTDRKCLAAALRAAADQMVVPLPQTPSEYDIAQYDGREEAIANLLNIADELETQ
jgi:hypothetical protein